MKKIGWLIGLALAIISACMIYLVITGVVLRSAPLIKPTLLKPDFSNAGHDVILRLYPDFANSHYVLLGLEPMNEERRAFLAALKSEGEKLLGKSVNIRENASAQSREDLASCEFPCWLILPEKNANELRPNPFITEKIVTLGRPYMSVSWIDFQRDEAVSEVCDHEKRLDLECLGPIGVREVARKLKQSSARYYFMRKYNDRDHFLFIENLTERRTEP